MLTTTYSFLAALFLLASPLLAAAQITYPECDSSWFWSFNSFGQSPCAVAAYLEGTCNHGDFTVPKLVPGESYVGPTGVNDTSDLCKCNTVVYSLMSACDACQYENAIWFSWKVWSLNCSAVDRPTTFSNLIPVGTRVPAWAFLDVTKEGSWDPVRAYQVGGIPELIANQTGTLSPPPTPTTTQTSVPGLSSSQANFASNNRNYHRNETVAIVGGVLGGLVFIALTIALFLWRQRIKRRKATKEAAAVILRNRVPLQEKVPKKNGDEPPPDVIANAI